MKKLKLNLFHNLFKPFKSLTNPDTKEEEEDLEGIAAKEQKLFTFETLVSATKDFHISNKLGEGGFGPVYKGKLEDGREIAVKKLAHNSRQGKKEFMNESKLLARVQHRNIVSLLGYCAHGVEKLLVYEYLPHESLDKFLFNGKRKGELDWKKRFDIIVGVAKGLLYLHEDCHITIIHRDIKAGNILLDEKWYPKVADFGMARLFPEDATHVNTRVAGTNGYMAPEYVMHGNLSAKADVFSFGVVMLELVSGQKNSTFSLDYEADSLLEWAWKLYKKGRSLEIVDPMLVLSEEVIEQVRMCIHIGLLCCQSDPVIRPLMKRVVVMLSRKAGSLEEPQRPGYPGSRYRRTTRSSHLGSSTISSQMATVTSSKAGSSGGSSSNTNASTSSATTSTTATRLVPRRRPHGKQPIQE